jgi:hypothetical protein
MVLDLPVRIRRAIRRVVSGVSSLLPSPPPDDAPPPDVDGRRPDHVDETKVKVGIQQKDGRGGFR